MEYCGRCGRKFIDRSMRIAWGKLKYHRKCYYDRVKEEVAIEEKAAQAALMKGVIKLFKDKGDDE